MSNIFIDLKSRIIRIAEKFYDSNLANLANIEIPKDPDNGDLSTNISMIIASKQKESSKEIAIKLKQELQNIDYISHIEVAGGFINFTIKASKWHEALKDILDNKKDFFEPNIGKGQKVNIEYVSANPTGPLHIGHARGAVLGDALAKILDKCGYKVTKEYYINDMGKQISDLLSSVLLRYKEVATQEKITMEENAYPGEYLIPIGEKIFEKYGNSLLINQNPKEAQTLIKPFVLSEIISLIKEDLKELSIAHDVFFSEQSLHENKEIEETVARLEQKGLIYKGMLPPPKGIESSNWEAKEQLLFRSSVFGDEQDRVVQRDDGTWTYLAADLAYAANKIKRGYDQLIYIMGADHSGYDVKIKAIVKALSDDKVACEVQMCKLVHFSNNGVTLKMSKRSGNFIELREVIDLVGADNIRFMMLMFSSEKEIDFDIQKVKEQAKDNPVFYVQYAYVRAYSILMNGKERIPLAYQKLMNKEIDFSYLSSEEEIALIKWLAFWPKILENAANKTKPHLINNYLLNIASKFHSMWNLGKDNNNYRFIIEEDQELSVARLALAQSIIIILGGAFEILGITALTKM